MYRGCIMAYGITMLFVLAVMGGVIAYLGDKIGSRVGKRKIKLFGLRPKYTSILITILTGISISAVTLGVMSVLSENVRIALFGMEQLRQQQAALEEQRDRLLSQAQLLGREMTEKNELLAQNEALLELQETQLDGANEQLRLTLLDLDQAQTARDDMGRQLDLVQVAYDEATRNLTSSREEIAALEETKARLTKTVQALDERNKLLNQSVTTIREGTVLFRVGEVLSSAVLPSGESEAATREKLSSVMNQINTGIRLHLGITDDKAVLLYISQEEFDAVVKQLSQAETGQKLVRVTAAGNIILGEPALVHVAVYTNNLIYHRGDVVFEERIDSSEIQGQAEYQVIHFLHNVNQKAQAAGLLPDPLTGNVGALTAAKMFDTIARIKGAEGRHVILRAIAAADVYTAGPLDITIDVDSERF
nr:DUF3084 domain-containing protein [uncultured Megasphaera sp.]